MTTIGSVSLNDNLIGAKAQDFTTNPLGSNLNTQILMQDTVTISDKNSKNNENKNPANLRKFYWEVLF